MRLLRSLNAHALICALAATGLASGPVLAQSVEPSVLSDHIRTLSDDSFLGRGIATEGERLTIDYLTRAFAEVGFEPGGENGGWTQDVTLNRFSVANVRAGLSVGDWALPLVQGENVVVSTRLPQASGHAMLQGLPLVFVGYGINAPERDWNDFEGVDVRGKIIVVLVNDADFEQPELGTFNGRAMTYYGRWTYKYEEAARQGAAGVLIVHEDAPASYGWATVRNSWTGDQFDIVRADPSAERVALEGWITRETAVALFQAAGLDFEALKAEARTPDFQAVELPGARLDAMFDVSTESIRTQNFLARLPGTTHPDETILYTAHWDHIGVGEPDDEGDAIFNGAVDNATGLAGLIEAARLFAEGPRPERSIVMIGFTAEESGLLGSEFYAANPVYPLETTVAGFNVDSMNVYGPTTDISVTGSGYSELEDLLAQRLAGEGRIVTPDPSPEAGYFFRSDHFSLAKRGVPMLYADGGSILVDGGAEGYAAASADYRANRYHQAGDEWSADWDLSGMAQDVVLLYRLGLDLANSRLWPNYNEGTEFRPLRDVSADARQ